MRQQPVRGGSQEHVPREVKKVLTANDTVWSTAPQPTARPGKSGLLQFPDSPHLVVSSCFPTCWQEGFSVPFNVYMKPPTLAPCYFTSNNSQRCLEQEEKTRLDSAVNQFKAEAHYYLQLRSTYDWINNQFLLPPPLLRNRKTVLF